MASCMQMLSNWIHCTKKSFFFLNIFWKDGLTEKNRTAIWSFFYCHIFGEKKCHLVFFFPKIWSYSLVGKWKMIFLKKYIKIWCFLYIRKRQYFFFLKTWNYPSVKKAKMVFSPKNTPKYDLSSITEKDYTHPEKNDIGIPGWHSRPPMVLCTFMEELYLRGDWAPIKENICPIGDGL